MQFVLASSVLLKLKNVQQETDTLGATFPLDLRKYPRFPSACSKHRSISHVQIELIARGTCSKRTLN